MAYQGDRLTVGPAVEFRFNNDNTHAVIVDGDEPNICGHLILNFGGLGGDYFHLARVHDVPRVMTEQGYRRYLQENKKRELGRFRLMINDPAAAILKLEELLSANSTRGMIAHNCASFVEQIVRAGGSSAGLYSNCPGLRRFD